MKERKPFAEWDVMLAAPFLKPFEGLKLNAYLCPAGRWTIGWGHTENVKPGDRISYDEAVNFLRQDLEKRRDSIASLVSVPVSRGEYIAILDFVFNLGIGNFRTSTLLKRLNSKQYQLAAEEFSRWIYARGNVLSGLVKRRAAERKLFLEE